MEVENDLEDDESMIFIKAREFLQLVGASAKTQNRQEYGDEFKASNDMNVKCNSEKHLNSEGAHYYPHSTLKKRKIKLENKNDKKRRKLERVKAPIISFVKESKQHAEMQINDDESVKKMFDYINKLPKQDVHGDYY